MITLPPTIVEAGLLLRQGRVSCAELTHAYLVGLETLQDVLHAMITITRERALRRAEALDTELKHGKDRGPLHGIPFVNKDLFAVQGVRCTVGSPLFQNRISPEDAAVVARLEKAGAVLLGQANLSEFAAVPTGRNNTYGDVRNPWNTAHSPGTSSSGSAVALAAGLCLAAIGSDTGNSARSPAAYCGVLGLRPTFGLISLAGAFPRAWSLDTAAPMTRSAHDMALMLNTLAGYDPADPHSLRIPTRDYTLGIDRGCAGLRLATMAEYTFHNVDPDVRDAVRTTLDALATEGAMIDDVSAPAFSTLDVNALNTVLLYEFNQIVGPIYDAVADPSRFDPAVRDNLDEGRRIASHVYARTLSLRPLLRRRMKKVFAQADLVCTPTTPRTAPAYLDGGAAWERQRRFLFPASVMGLPALSVPCGLSAQGLPIGLQLIGPPLSEPLLLRVAAVLEKKGFFSQQPAIHWLGMP